MNHQALYIVDNASEEQSVRKYLSEWCGVSKQMDIATGYLEVGGILALDAEWQKIDKIRIILGNEMTKRTKTVIDAVVSSILHRIKESVDQEQDRNEFLVGVPAILAALQCGKIECRVFDHNKFHAKAYITHFRDEYRAQFISAMNIPTGYALVGSSNFTKAGLTQNVELNVQIRDDVEQLQQWFNDRWEQGQDITQAVLKVIENHCREFSPYDVYLRSMYEYFKGREGTVTEWENTSSVIFPHLSQYQKDGYNSLIEIANRYHGAFLCDGVGLGKTFVGMMLIERYVKRERKNVVLIVPASARVSVWETTIKRYIPEILEGFFPFKIINHTDLLLEKNANLMNQIADQAEIVIIDEAHHFRNRSSRSYRKLFEIIGNGSQKMMFMLTATPINNSFLDLQHLIELFTQRKEDYFSEAPLGIHSLPGHFRKMEAKLASITGVSVSDSTDVTTDIFRTDPLVNQLVVQRSRAYVRESLSSEEGSKVLFSKRQPPIVANYSLKKGYGDLIDDFIASFYRKDKSGKIVPILALAVYSPYEDIYFKGDKSKIDEMVSGRQAQVVNLIRQLLLKRFESSIAAFEETCIRIYIRLKKFVTDYQEFGHKNAVDRLFAHEAQVIDYVEHYATDFMLSTIDELEDSVPDYVWNTEENFSIEEFDIRAMLDDTMLDMEVLSGFIKHMMAFKPENDDKIRELKRILTEDEHAVGKKVIIFSEFKTTAKYIYGQLMEAGFDGLYEIDSSNTKNDRYELIQRFAPYYNGTSSADISNEVRILVSTDVLAEGLNLQDASCLINYELHWNPVRLMQRIGRVDRRRDAEIERRLLDDHPELMPDRENAYYWNFLPPDELERLLDLYKTVSRKTLRISYAFGIEGKQLLTPQDDYDALKDFNSSYEGVTSGEEEMALAYQQMLAINPSYELSLHELPKKMYSGRISSIRKGYFFCYELPIKRIDGTWSQGDGLHRWYFLDAETGSIHDDSYAIWKLIRCEESEPRVVTCTADSFIEKRKTIETYLKRSYLRTVQAPIGVSPRLIAWMELN